MRFTSEEIEQAGRLKALGLPWTPTPGHYVWDETDLIEQGSPFHDRVFFILDLKHFLRRAGSIEQLKAAVRWLPTWYDARQSLAALGVSDAAVAQTLNDRRAVAAGRERLVLYEMLAEALTGRADA